MNPLDSPVWNALTSHHRGFAEGGPLALRYAPAVAPFGAVAERSPEAFAALRALIPPEGRLMLHTPDQLVPPAGFFIDRQAPLSQMVLDGAPRGTSAGPEHVTLGLADVPEMIDLAERTHPGPFGPRTIEFGLYIGIRIDGRLAAMAGERMRVGDFVEISAVCVDPDFRGQGYAGLLMTRLAERIRAAGKTPFLHVLAENEGAIALYDKLGFVKRGAFFITLVGKAPTA